MRNPLIAAKVFGTPVLMDERKAENIAYVIMGETPPSLLPYRAGPEGDLMAGYFERAQNEPFWLKDGLALISVDGTLVNRGAWIGASSGLTSYSGLQAQIARARSSDQVKAVIFEFDSYGGEVQGVKETAANLAALSLEKPTAAILNANACSAAYWLASMTREIWAPEDAMVGSIGALIIHQERSREFEQQGVTFTIIRSGARKAEGNSLEPLTDDLQSRLQADVDRIGGQFAEMVAMVRPGLTKQAVLDTEAACFGGEEALALGLIDRVSEPSAAFATLREQFLST